MEKRSGPSAIDYLDTRTAVQKVPELLLSKKWASK